MHSYQTIYTYALFEKQIHMHVCTNKKRKNITGHTNRLMNIFILSSSVPMDPVLHGGSQEFIRPLQLQQVPAMYTIRELAIHQPRRPHPTWGFEDLLGDAWSVHAFLTIDAVYMLVDACNSALE